MTEAIARDPRRTLRIRSIVVCLLLGVAPASCIHKQADTTKLPTVAIIGTGGTIAGESRFGGSVTYQSGKLTVEQVARSVPGLLEIAEIVTEQVVNIPSQDMTDSIWLSLAGRINELSSVADVDGIVVTHGTDTMEETAYFLDLVLHTAKPVVLVGAMKPPGSPNADGARNLFDAVSAASDRDSWNRPVLVAMNGELHSAKYVTKSHTIAVDAFKSLPLGPIGRVYRGDASFIAPSERVGSRESPFSILDLQSLPRVDVLYGYANAPASLVSALVDDGVKGIVYAGVGNGNISKPVLDALRSAVEAGVVVCRSRRTFAGPVTVPGEVDDAEYGFVVSPARNPQKSRVLLQLALSASTDRERIQELLNSF